MYQKNKINTSVESQYIKTSDCNDVSLSANEIYDYSCQREALGNTFSQNNDRLQANKSAKEDHNSYKRNSLDQTSMHQCSETGVKLNDLNKTLKHSQQKQLSEKNKHDSFTQAKSAHNKNISGNSPYHTDNREVLNEIKCWFSKHTKSNQTNVNYTAIFDENQNAKANSGKTNTSKTTPTQKSATDSDEEDSFVHVGANFTAYMTKNMVNVSINGTKSNALCDTGATVSCMSKRFFEKAFPEQKPNINPCQIKSIVGVGGTHHPVLGVIQIEVKFGTLGLVYPFYIIEDLHHSIIIGHDFMETHNVTLDIKGKKMIIQDHIKVCTLQTNTGYARTVKPVTLPANRK